VLLFIAIALNFVIVLAIAMVGRGKIWMGTFK
jgi:hypothetical protein